MTEKPDLIERLINLHDYGLTDRERCEMRSEAAAEIVRLRDRVEQFEELNRFRVQHELSGSKLILNRKLP